VKQLDWRRSQVLQYSSQGYSEREVGEIMKVSDSAVHRDLIYLRKQAQENLQRHIHEIVPAEYQKCYTQINQVLQKAWEIVNKTADEKTRLQALALIDQCNSHKMDMVTNGVIITNALDYVNGKAEKLSEIAKSNKEIFVELEPELTEENEVKTTNDVF
jgi:hypothetical protein